MSAAVSRPVTSNTSTGEPATVRMRTNMPLMLSFSSTLRAVLNSPGRGSAGSSRRRRQAMRKVSPTTSSTLAGSARRRTKRRTSSKCSSYSALNSASFEIAIVLLFWGHLYVSARSGPATPGDRTGWAHPSR